jgi:hypothetical protein
MPRKPNRIKTVQLTLSTTQSVARYLDELVLTGLYGKNPADAAERMLVRAIHRLVDEGALGRHRGITRTARVGTHARRSR